MAKIINITSAFLTNAELQQVIEAVDDGKNFITFGSPITVEILDLEKCVKTKMSTTKTGWLGWFKRVR